MNGTLKHTNQLGKCLVDAIKALAENCDNEYYMSAIGSPYGTLERAKRGMLRIKKGIIELERMNKEISCLACHQEIESQIKLQRDGVLEFERAWMLSE